MSRTRDRVAAVCSTILVVAITIAVVLGLVGVVVRALRWGLS